MKKCINCGAELLDEAAFCSHCGTACEDDTATQPLENDEATTLLEECILQETETPSSDSEEEATTLLDEEMLENPSSVVEESTSALSNEKISPKKTTMSFTGEIQQNESDTLSKTDEEEILKEIEKHNQKGRKMLYYITSIVLLISLIIVICTVFNGN